MILCTTSEMSSMIYIPVSDTWRHDRKNLNFHSHVGQAPRVLSLMCFNIWSGGDWRVLLEAMLVLSLPSQWPAMGFESEFPNYMKGMMHMRRFTTNMSELWWLNHHSSRGYTGHIGSICLASGFNCFSAISDTTIDGRWNEKQIRKNHHQFPRTAEQYRRGIWQVRFAMFFSCLNTLGQFPSTETCSFLKVFPRPFVDDSPFQAPVCRWFSNLPSNQLWQWENPWKSTI